jgi:hypothetical protein
VGQRALDADGLLLGGNDGAALEHRTQPLDVFLRPVGEM